jgi:hypothetical protein
LVERDAVQLRSSGQRDAYRRRCQCAAGPRPAPVLLARRRSDRRARPAWNFLVGHTDPAIKPKIAHFTEGGPWFPGCERVPYAGEWREARDQSARHDERFQR